MGTIEQGVKQALEICLKVKNGEKALIITDEETLKIGLAFKSSLEKIAGETQSFIMEDFGTRPIGFPKQIENAIASAEVSIYAAQGAVGELQTFRMKMLKAIEANKKLRHAHMIGITEQIMKDGMCSDYQEIQRVSKLVFNKVKNAKKIIVNSERGNYFVAEFSKELKWFISDGIITPGFWNNLPDGEVFTSPYTVNGAVVFDGCLGDFFTEKYGSLDATPVTIEVENGRAIKGSIQCKNEHLLQEFNKYIFETDQNSNRIGEFAIGTNTGLTKLIYNLLQDEKFPGIHIAFGSPIPAKTNARWDSIAHVDGIIKHPTIRVDDVTIMEKGVFCL
jgi:aminopeptidase